MESTNEDVGAVPGGRLERRLELCLGEHLERAGDVPEPLGAQPHLLGRLLSGEVEHVPAAVTDGPRHLQRERRLADAGITAEQDQRARHEAAAEYAIHLGKAGRHPNGLGELDVAQRAHPHLAGRFLRHPSRRRRRRHRHAAIVDLLLGAVPRLADRTAAKPARLVLAALLAQVHGFVGGLLTSWRHGSPRDRGRSLSYRYSVSTRDRFSKRVNSLRKATSTSPTGPFRCLATLTVALPRLSSVGW